MSIQGCSCVGGGQSIVSTAIAPIYFVLIVDHQGVGGKRGGGLPWAGEGRGVGLSRLEEPHCLMNRHLVAVYIGRVLLLQHNREAVTDNQARGPFFLCLTHTPSRPFEYTATKAVTAVYSPSTGRQQQQQQQKQQQVSKSQLFTTNINHAQKNENKPACLLTRRDQIIHFHEITHDCHRWCIIIRHHHKPLHPLSARGNKSALTDALTARILFLILSANSLMLVAPLGVFRRTLLKE